MIYLVAFGKGPIGMPLQNRVRPDGDIVSTDARGLLMGNRGGRLHDDRRLLGHRRWVGKAWICCLTRFKARRRQVMGHGYTELFFLDEATALAAGHRPCFECRRTDALRFAELWNAARGLPGRAMAHEMDEVLHRQRLTAAGDKLGHRARLDGLPDGTMLRLTGGIGLWFHEQLWPWTPSGYLDPQSHALDHHPDGSCLDVLTPPASVAVLGAGYLPVLHGSIRVRADPLADVEEPA